jgi:hypothetical protein
MHQFTYFLLYLARNLISLFVQTQVSIVKIYTRTRLKAGCTVQVYRNPEPQMFSLEVGPNVDIAFLTICTAAIDLLQLRQDVTSRFRCLKGAQA